MDAWEFRTSPEFMRIMHGVTTLSMVVAIGISIAAMAYFVRPRENTVAGDGEQKWSMLFATLRDGLIITVLFVAQNFVMRFGDFSSHLSDFSGSLHHYAPVMTPTLLFISDILIFAVAMFRIVVLSRFLGRLAQQI